MNVRRNSKRRNLADKRNIIKAVGILKDSKQGMLEHQGAKLICPEDTINAEKSQVGKKFGKSGLTVEVDKPDINNGMSESFRT